MYQKTIRPHRRSQAIREHRAGTFRSAAGWDASAFTRENEAGQLAGFLNELLFAGSAARTRRDSP